MDLEALYDNYTHNNDQLLDQIIFSVKIYWYVLHTCSLVFEKQPAIATH